MESADVRITAAMTAPLDSLVSVEFQKMPVPQVVAGWDLPDDAKGALASVAWSTTSGASMIRRWSTTGSHSG